MRIAVASISLNEEQFVKRWALSCDMADYRLILDTGSTDNTVDLAWDLGVTVQVKEFTPWRFDHARNHAMSLIPEDIDYVIWLDMDEVLQPGWRQALESIPEGTTRPRYRYVWSWNEDGSEGLVYGGDKIHSRHGYRWKHPVHEVLKYEGLETQHWTNGLEIHHHPDHTKSRAQYLPLLKLAVQEDPKDDRNQFYLARELFFQNDYGLAEFHFNEHLKLSSWSPERAASYRYLAKMKPERAEFYLYQAIAESPNRREPWVELAQIYHNRHDWERCRSSCQMALAVAEKPLDYLCEAFAWGWLLHDLMAISSFRLGDIKTAFEHGSIAVSLNQDDERLKKNLTYYHE
jgi:tetratricopeptide (TPR) repeat protein